MKDLFGNEINETKVPKHGYARALYLRHYRLAVDKRQSCKTCKHLRKKDSYSRNYYKCALIGNSNCVSTDIRLRNVCDLWDMRIDSIDDFFNWLDTLTGVNQADKQLIKKKLNEYENPGGNS